MAVYVKTTKQTFADTFVSKAKSTLLNVSDDMMTGAAMAFGMKPATSVAAVS